jgi:pimeloyl-ACP methyl ester carboxylesterase
MVGILDSHGQQHDSNSAGLVKPTTRTFLFGSISRYDAFMDEFTLRVEDVVVRDLHERLRRTRFARPTPGPDGAAGISPRYLRDLVDHWLHEFDWRKAETRINRHPQFTADVGGVRMHAAFRRAPDEHAPVVVLLHGWPYSFVEMLPLVDALPEAHVIAPSLPGFAFSTAPPDYVATSQAMADTIHQLVTEQFGFGRYFIYGEDVGAPVSQWLAATRPEEIRGIHDTHAVFPPREAVEDEEGREFFRWFDAQWEGAMGYAGPGNARHDTIAASLADSPAGLAAWIVEKFRDWSDCDGEVEHRFDKRSLLTTVMLYWITDTFVSAYRPHQMGLPVPPMPIIQVPATVAVQRHEWRYPRSFAERAYGDLRHFSVMPRGGHFTAAEEPELVAESIRGLLAHVRISEER